MISRIKIHEREKRRKKFIRYSTAVSAAIILIIGSHVGYNTILKPDIYLAQQSNSTIKLADGTMVTLLKGAKLTVEKSFSADAREVLLEGDAVFNVTKSKEHPFIVHGLNYETKVLGTVFKVTQQGKTFKVDLFEGKVLVYRTGHPKDPVILKPQQTFTNFGILQAASVTKTEDIKTTVTKDRSANLTFRECPINDAVGILEKTFGITIHYPAELENTKITLALSDATADECIQTLATQLNLNSRQNNDSIFKLEK
ncbi:FecR family protein [Chryseobacterium sp. MEBOG07]|uniref:FecR family protein n=1 Tax=Chryseobacterium sp. MEBOG07 TaxID=2879939 RepID=UPI001F215EEC|nr:FecR family protein [Chryseobacterium sp. MEBOG07]UKB78590.1 FecR family protein [Chryseobacterium sp. MEBOG07]